MSVFFAFICVFAAYTVNETNGQRFCEGAKLRSGYKFFRQNKTLKLIRRTYDPSAGLQRLRCEMSRLITYDDQTHEIVRRFYYSDLNLRNPATLVNGRYYVIPKRATAVFLMRYSEIYHRYDLMKSKQLEADAFYSLLPPTWMHLYTNKNCTVVRIPPGKRNIRGGPLTYPRTRRFHCEIWVTVNYHGPVDNSTGPEPPRVACCVEIYKKLCQKMEYDADSNDCNGFRVRSPYGPE